jgi:hypothetical protein
VALAAALLVRGVTAVRLVGLLDLRVVLGLGVAAVGVGVSTVTASGVAASRLGVSTLGVRVVAVASALVTAAAGVALLLLRGLGLGVGIAVAYLGVAGIGVAALTARGGGVPRRRARVARLAFGAVSRGGGRAGRGVAPPRRDAPTPLAVTVEPPTPTAATPRPRTTRRSSRPTSRRAMAPASPLTRIAGARKFPGR